MSTRSILTATLALVALGLVRRCTRRKRRPLPSASRGRSGRSSPPASRWRSRPALGALAQGRAVSAAVEAIARNPSAAGDIRGNLMLGLVLIESLVIYVLLISLILFFLKPFSG